MAGGGGLGGGGGEVLPNKEEVNFFVVDICSLFIYFSYFKLLLSVLKANTLYFKSLKFTKQ